MRIGETYHIAPPSVMEFPASWWFAIWAQMIVDAKDREERRNHTS